MTLRGIDWRRAARVTRVNDVPLSLWI